VPLVKIHRLGVSLIGKLRRLATALRRTNPFASLAPALDIFEADDSQVLEILTRPHPVFPRLLDHPPAAGERPFASLADLATATHAVERAAASIALLRKLGVEAAQLSPDALAAMSHAAGEAAAKTFDPAAIDCGVVARTVLVRQLLGLPVRPLAGLAREHIDKFKSSFNKQSRLPADAERQVLQILTAENLGAPLQGAALDVAARWLASLCPLGPVLGAQRLG
jgi:hypothetical protein